MRKSLPFGEPDSEAVRTSPPRARDWVAAGLVAVLSVTEVLIRDDMAWRPLALAVGLILSWAIMWRRRQPLLALVVAFSTFAIIGVVSVVVVGDGEPDIMPGPTTSIPGCELRIVVSPARMMPWSSASSTRMVTVALRRGGS